MIRRVLVVHMLGRLLLPTKRSAAKCYKNYSARTKQQEKQQKYALQGRERRNWLRAFERTSCDATLVFCVGSRLS